MSIRPSPLKMEEILYNTYRQFPIWASDDPMITDHRMISNHPMINEISQNLAWRKRHAYNEPVLAGT
jgi:hypothetical protein